MITMTKEELEEATDIILNSIIDSKLDNYTKVELLINLKNFLFNYDENIKILRNNEKRL